MQMKRILFPLIIVLLSILFYLRSDSGDKDEPDVYAETKGTILVPLRNVTIAALDLEKAGLSFTSSDDIKELQTLQKDFSGLAGVKKVESLLNASRVISRLDEIIVSRAIPQDDSLLSDSYLRELDGELDDFPELSPYISSDRKTLLFYVYYSNRTPSIEIYQSFLELREKWKNTLPFDFTGRATIIAETENLLTKDIVLFFPVLGIMVILVFSLFRSIKAIFASVFLILLSVLFSYGFVRFLGFSHSPLILLIPVFSLGLLSDYLIHYFYHHFHTPMEEGKKSLRNLLLFPLSLTALSTLTGFISLSLINGSGHIALGLLIATAVVVTWFGVFFWLDFTDFPSQRRHLLNRFRQAQGKMFSRMGRFRIVFFFLITCASIWGACSLRNLSIEPYPIGQLPESTTIKRADRIINEEFYGTAQFFIEVDTGEQLGVLKKETQLELDRIHKLMEKEGVGYAFSLLSVLKRMNYYFMGDENSFLETSEFDDYFDALIEQYLLYYSSSVDPLDYESLLDSSYRYFSIKGLIYYNDYRDLDGFYTLMAHIEENLPENWSLEIHGMVDQLRMEQNNLRTNWLLSFAGGSLMIFITVLIFYRKLRLALLSLVPGIISMLISFGLINLSGISIDAFSIIFVAIITGLVVDYSIHTLVALDRNREAISLEEGFSGIVGFSGIPIFLSFLTSLLSFSVLFFSSFSGARNLGFLLVTSLVLSFFMSLYLIPLIILPGRIKSEKKDA